MSISRWASWKKFNKFQFASIAIDTSPNYQQSETHTLYIYNIEIVQIRLEKPKNALRIQHCNYLKYKVCRGRRTKRAIFSLSLSLCMPLYGTFIASTSPSHQLLYYLI